MILQTFYYLATLGLLIKVFLIWANIKHIRKNRHKVPEAFIELISLEDHQRAADYTTAKLKFQTVSIVFHFLLLICWLPLGGMAFVDELARSFNLATIQTGLVFFGIYFIISLLLNLPESLYSTFVLEEKFGFNKTTARTFILDLAKQLLLSIILMAPLLWGILYFVKSYPHSWWLYSWISIVIFQFIIIWAYPKFISPLFNKFTLLDDSELKKSIDELSRAASIDFDSYYVMNASMRSSHGNAYFTGFGKNKRIVFFDTLLSSLNKEEVISVLAHELGHHKLKHIVKSITINTLFMGVGFYIVSQAFNNNQFFTSFKLQPSAHTGLLLFSHLIPIMTFFLTPISSWFSRRNEYEADQFSVKFADGKSLISALVKMYKDNSNSLTPSPLYTKFYNSHPAAIERVAFINNLVSSSRTRKDKGFL